MDILNVGYAKGIIQGFQVITDDVAWTTEFSRNRHFGYPILSSGGEVQFHPEIEEWFAHVNGKNLDGSHFPMNPVYEAYRRQLLFKQKQLVAFYQQLDPVYAAWYDAQLAAGKFPPFLNY